jgi:hypothetical protein
MSQGGLRPFWLKLQHPDFTFAPSTWLVLAGHCDQESSITWLFREV